MPCNLEAGLQGGARRIPHTPISAHLRLQVYWDGTSESFPPSTVPTEGHGCVESHGRVLFMLFIGCGHSRCSCG